MITSSAGAPTIGNSAAFVCKPMDFKSKPKEEKYLNEVCHDHQQGVSFGIVNSDSSTAYKGFGTVVDSSSLSRKESMGESYDDEDSNSIGAATSQMPKMDLKN